MMFHQESFESETTSTNLDHFSSQRDVIYSCGTCGYTLNLSSSNRNTGDLGSKYRKSMKRGVVPFYMIDESRFTHMDELKCLPFFGSKNSWGLFRMRTKLLCHNCGNYIGTAYEEPSPPVGSDNSDSSSGNRICGSKKYNIKIRALQPSSSDLDVPIAI